MLQQTQVATVIPYYQRFMQTFPDVQSLAAASEDQVLHLWTGLGYYSRARNLLKSAQIIAGQHGGDFPDSVEALCELPGIGRSTAGAIVAIAFSLRAVILDGNVKRVLARHHTIGGWYGKTVVANQLWDYAKRHTPSQRCADYTQAIMDLGATLCTRSKPDCQRCPLTASCKARQGGNQALYPGKKPKKALPVKGTQMLLIENQHGELLLEKRPATGIWGGLWICPQIEPGLCAADFCQQLLGTDLEAQTQWPSFRHTFSHYHLDINPSHLQLAKPPSQIMEADRWLWYNIHQPPSVGLAAPVKKLIEQLRNASR